MGEYPYKQAYRLASYYRQDIFMPTTITK